MDSPTARRWGYAPPSSGEGVEGGGAGTGRLARGAAHLRQPGIAAGLNAKTLSTDMGHANISITLDRYGHLMPGNEAEARDLLDAYLDANGG